MTVGVLKKSKVCLESLEPVRVSLEELNKSKIKKSKRIWGESEHAWKSLETGCLSVMKLMKKS